jgi:hypothetical protein
MGHSLDAEPPHGIDALLPPEMAEKAERVGVAKTRLDVASLLALALLAGAFIALGSAFSFVVVAGAEGIVPYGMTRLLGGFAFSLGLILVIVGGAELFTGNNLMVMACASGRVGARGCCVPGGSSISATSWARRASRRSCSWQRAILREKVRSGPQFWRAPRPRARSRAWRRCCAVCWPICWSVSRCGSASAHAASPTR